MQQHILSAGSPVGKNLPASADAGLILGSGRSSERSLPPWEERTATHFSVLAWKKPMHGGAWWATVRLITESGTTERLRKDAHTY